MSPSRLNQQLVLSDGRRLGYNEYGKPEAQAVFYFHGSPSARIEWELFGTEQLTDRFNLRIISVDRPGMGLSDFLPDRSITDWPADVIALANYLSLRRFGILGFSGGTSYAAVCALKIPERITTVGLVSTIAPFTVPGLTEGIDPRGLQFLEASRDNPHFALFIQRMMALTARFAPKKFIAQALLALPVPDQAVMERLEMQQAFIRMVREAFRQGPRGVQWDTALMVSSWDFDPAEIRIPVHIWKGALDTNAPLAMAHYLAEAIPDSRLTVFPQDGHLSPMVHHIQDILAVFQSVEA